MIRRCVLAFSFVLALAAAEPAEATCIGDWWGARSSSAISNDRLEVSMTALTSLHHTENHFNCGG